MTDPKMTEARAREIKRLWDDQGGEHLMEISQYAYATGFLEGLAQGRKERDAYREVALQNQWHNCDELCASDGHMEELREIVDAEAARILEGK